MTSTLESRTLQPPGGEDRVEFGAQDLERDFSVVAHVVREVDGGHGAGAELALDAVAVGEGGRRGRSRVAADRPSLTPRKQGEKPDERTRRRPGGPALDHDRLRWTRAVRSFARAARRDVRTASTSQHLETFAPSGGGQWLIERHERQRLGIEIGEHDRRGQL